MSLKRVLLGSFALGALFLACGDTVTGSTKNDCEEAADDIEDKAEECGLAVDPPEDDGEVNEPECTDARGSALECYAACFEAVSCETLKGQDLAGAEAYLACFEACPALPDPAGGASSNGGSAADGGAGAGAPEGGTFSEGGFFPEGGSFPEGGRGSGEPCVLDPACARADLDNCVCSGCDPAGCYLPDADPPVISDCTCPICQGDESCGCDLNGSCDPFFEDCACGDCAPFC